LKLTVEIDFHCENEPVEVTVGEGGADAVNGVTGLGGTFDAVTETETHRTPRILSGPTAENTRSD